MDINEKRLVIRFRDAKDKQLYDLIKSKNINEEELKNFLFMMLVRKNKNERTR